MVKLKKKYIYNLIKLKQYSASVPSEKKYCFLFTNKTSRLEFLDNVSQFLHIVVLVGVGRLVLRYPALGPALNDQAAGVLEPDLLPGLLGRDSLALGHGHGDQVGDPDGGFTRS